MSFKIMNLIEANLLVCMDNMPDDRVVDCVILINYCYMIKVFVK